MSVILSLETSTKVCSVSVFKDGQPLAYAETLIEKSHAEKITLLIEQVMQNARLVLADIDAVAISKGPGSYTGLRIASSTAKGLVYALEKKFIAVDTLQSMAYGFKGLGAMVCPMIDARRMEVYCAVYNSENTLLSPVEAKVIEGNVFEELMTNNTLIFCGDGAAKCKSLIQHSSAVFIDDVYPSAKNIGYVASEMYEKGEFADPVSFEPYYLKEFFFTKPKNQVLQPGKSN